MATNTIYYPNPPAAGEALTAGTFVYITGGTTMMIDDSTQATCTKTQPIGVVERACASGEYPAVVAWGFCKVLAGGTIAVGDVLIPKASAGSAIAFATTGLSNNDLIFRSARAVSAGISTGLAEAFINAFDNGTYYGA